MMRLPKFEVYESETGELVTTWFDDEEDTYEIVSYDCGDRWIISEDGRLLLWLSGYIIQVPREGKYTVKFLDTKELVKW